MSHQNRVCPDCGECAGPGDSDYCGGAKDAMTDKEYPTHEQQGYVAVRLDRDAQQVFTEIWNTFDKIILAERKAREDMRERAAQIAEGGRFLHDEALDAILGRACAKAIRSLKVEP